MQAIPGIRFDWVVEEGFAQIPGWHQAVDRVIPVAIRRWRKAWFSAPIKAERQAFREAVQAQHYDAIIDAQGLVKSAALVTRLAHGVKHGMDWHSALPPCNREAAARGGTHPGAVCQKPGLCETRHAGGLRDFPALPARFRTQKRALSDFPARHHPG
jgi:hypothetical protein